MTKTASIPCFTTVLAIFLLESCFVKSDTSVDTAMAERGGEYCETEVFRAACSDNEVILLVRARYGRMRLGRCVEFDLGYIDCYTDILTRLDRRCSGRRTCQVRIPDAEFESTGPCLKELKTYLEVSYLCVQVEAPSIEYCTMNSYINVTLPTGYISNRPPTTTTSLADQQQSPGGHGLGPMQTAAVDPASRQGPLSSSTWTSAASAPASAAALPLQPPGLLSTGDGASIVCDHSTKPWVVAAARGQRVNLTLYDFALDDAHVTNVQRTQESGRICRQYGWLDDSAFDRPMPLCAGDRRVTHLYSSRGHVVKIWTMPSSAVVVSSSPQSPSTATGGGGGVLDHLLPQQSATSSVDGKRFMIKYTVIGCPDPEFALDQTWFERSQDGLSATMGCVNADVKWSVYCINNVWVGYHANCSSTQEQHRDDSGGHTDESAIPYGLAIGVGAVFGICIAIIVVIIVGCRRRDTGRGTRAAATILAATSDKRLPLQQQQQLQLRPLDDYTYYSSSIGKPMTATSYDCSCAADTDYHETGSGDLYADRKSSRRHQQTAVACPEQLSTTCDLCAVQLPPSSGALFEYLGTAASSASSSTYYDRTPWQTSTYSRLPVLSQSGNNVETTYGPARVSHNHQQRLGNYSSGNNYLPQQLEIHPRQMPNTPDMEDHVMTRIEPPTDTARSTQSLTVTTGSSLEQCTGSGLHQVDRESVLT